MKRCRRNGFAPRVGWSRQRRHASDTGSKLTSIPTPLAAAPTSPRITASSCLSMTSATDLSKIQVDVGTPEGEMIFHSAASKLDFKGYQSVYEDTEGDSVHEDNFEALSKLMVAVKDLVSPVNVHLGQHFTKPPSRYSEGALIKKLEELGIGRPSTYASIMKVLQDRKYVTAKSRVLHPEFRGRMVSAFLLHHFSEVADYSFTANMETELDNVSAGLTEWKGLLKGYWERFSKYCADASNLDGRKVERMLEEKFGPILFPNVDTDNRICPRYIARSLSQQEDETEPTEECQKTFTPRLLGVMPDSDEKVFSFYEI
ncbi:DNA topoisomerase type IA core [Zea mays]|uniref:DNA topoisomerase type IA core n=1 Tax=Zea mays TaxID=4577 RepID=A0A1D6NYQ1_MAIZE|nr:DNA topoisomerase type IA core [Zea mays]